MHDHKQWGFLRSGILTKRPVFGTIALQAACFAKYEYGKHPTVNPPPSLDLFFRSKVVITEQVNNSIFLFHRVKLDPQADRGVFLAKISPGHMIPALGMETTIRLNQLGPVLGAFQSKNSASLTALILAAQEKDAGNTSRRCADEKEVFSSEPA